MLYLTIIGCTLLIIVCLGGARKLGYIAGALCIIAAVVMLLNKLEEPQQSAELSKAQRDAIAEQEARAWVLRNGGKP